MSIQDNTEKVLRKLHIMFAEAQEYPDNNRYIIVEKWQAQKLLNDLNNCMNSLLEEYELTKESRDAFERASRKQGDQIIEDSKRRADDVYAASVLYSNEALTELWKIIHDSAEAMEQVYSDMDRKLQAQKRTVRKNQSELKAHLRNMEDTEKYMRLMNEENRRIEAERRERNRVIRQETSVYADREPEVKVDKNILAKLGLQPVMDVESLDDFEEETPIFENNQTGSQEIPTSDYSFDASKENTKNEENKPGKMVRNSAEDEDADSTDYYEEIENDGESDLIDNPDESAGNETSDSEDISEEITEPVVSDEDDQLVRQIDEAILEAAEDEMSIDIMSEKAFSDGISEKITEEDSYEEEADKVSLQDILRESKENLIDNTNPDEERNPDEDLITINLEDEKKDKINDKKKKKPGFTFRRK